MDSNKVERMKQFPKIRHVDFGLDKLEVTNHWFRDNMIITHFLNSFHMVFPPGERFFIRSVKAFSEQLKDEGLKKRVKAFIAQEVNHGREHEKFYRVLEEKGYKPEVYLNFYEQMAYGTIEKITNTILSEKMSLSVTVALEHHTAILAEAAFSSDELHELPDEMRKMLLWHAAEEIEHKAVAFDVLKEIDDSYFLRIAGMIIGTAYLALFVLLGQAYFISQDREIKLSNLFSDILGVGNFIQKIGAGYVKNFFDYFRIDFHPDDIDNAYLAKEYFETEIPYIKKTIAA